MKRTLLVVATLVLYALHQDVWFWRTPHPILFGFLPIGLFYHVIYTLAVAVLMWALVRYAWPVHLEKGWGDKEAADNRPTPPSPRLSVAEREGRNT